MTWSLPLPAEIQSTINLYCTFQNMPHSVLNLLYDWENYDGEMGNMTNWSFISNKQRVHFIFEYDEIYTPLNFFS